MGLREIGDVNVIADTGSVGGGVIDSEDFEMRPAAMDNLAGDFDEMRCDGAALSATTLRVGAGNVEVAKGHVA